MTTHSEFLEVRLSLSQITVQEIISEFLPIRYISKENDNKSICDDFWDDVLKMSKVSICYIIKDKSQTFFMYEGVLHDINVLKIEIKLD